MVFLGELGNTIPLNLCNALGLPVVVLSSAMHHPLINITLIYIRVPIPLFVAYNQYGAGHYDALVVSNTAGRHQELQVPSTPVLPTEVSKCTCGKNDKSGEAHCQPHEMKYTSVTRCQCYANKRTCTHLCKCKNCSNPFGSRPMVADITPARKRPKQQWQCTIPKSVLLAMETMQSFPHGSRTILEFHFRGFTEILSEGRNR